MKPLQDPIPILGYASPRGWVPRPVLSSRTRSAIKFLYCVGVIGLATYPLISPEIRHYNSTNNLPLIEVLRPQWSAVRVMAVTIGLTLVCIASLILLANKRILLGLGIGFGCLCAGFWSIIAGFHYATVTVGNEILGADGATYCIVDTSYEKGYELAVGRLVASGPLYQTVDLLATANLGRSPYLQVVRPSGGYADDGTLYATMDGHIAACIGSWDEISCYLVYDTVTSRLLDLHAQSPFLLVNATGPIDSKDEMKILASLRATGASDKVVPTKDVLSAGLSHPNPAVRASAARMLKALKP